jgi:hypothetical protein
MRKLTLSLQTSALIRLISGFAFALRQGERHFSVPSTESVQALTAVQDMYHSISAKNPRLLLRISLSIAEMRGGFGLFEPRGGVRQIAQAPHLVPKVRPNTER